jgi:hypothetical protein
MKLNVPASFQSRDKFCIGDGVLATRQPALAVNISQQEEYT